MSAAPRPGGLLTRVIAWAAGELIVRLCVIALLAWMALPALRRRRP